MAMKKATDATASASSGVADFVMGRLVYQSDSVPCSLRHVAADDYAVLANAVERPPSRGCTMSMS